MDIDSGILLKKIIHKSLAVFHKFYKRTEVGYDLENTGDDVVKQLLIPIDFVQEHTLAKHQNKYFVEPLKFGLWVSSKDAAYEDQRDYALYQIVHDDKLKEALASKRAMNDFMNPDNWHANRGIAAKKKTESFQKKDIISKDMICSEEGEFCNMKHYRLKRDNIK